MDPFLGEVRLFGGTFAPLNWALCDGRLLSISTYDALFNLIGTTYGGDGQTNFGVPDLRGRAPVHAGQGTGLSQYVLGQMGGTESVTLTATQIPAHSHAVVANPVAGTQTTPSNGVFAGGQGVSPWDASPPQTQMDTQSVQAAGGSLPHENRQPLVCVTFIIALQGIYPTPA
jgi:microcystin-dependent protein